ncbi:protein adenylyltransferase SelO family protein [Asticcacaulis sp. AND118]|uniref:protein adenylyltransferase SelO family protein n=1 Tax=Asticcacaulis sp. AND118 TaxID=2840468 RepID=UPI001D000993|nr:YdiU family protein [Asticcacaulis sp. AND118]UDF04355.1 YdiU family protein [Asticcacaulis sp. AND118]
MPISADYRPDARLENSGLVLFDRVAAADFPQTVLRYRNERAAGSVGLADLSDDEWIAHFGRFTPLPGNQTGPLALRYHGHQFRHYNPDLGDGRGFLFAQMQDDRNRLLDLGTKGSGTTPWSRGGDGRLTLKGGVREVLATALLEALGVNTSKSFSLIETGESLRRYDEPSPTRAAVLVRLSHSHIRFGTFERLAYHNETEAMTALVRYAADNYYPELIDLHGADLTHTLFDAVVTKTAELTTQWMCAGFVHGVLNTDNMSLTGESFDYGPYRFLPHYEPGFVAAYFDEGGLYAYARQPDAVFWNLTQLARCLSLIGDSQPLIDSLNAFTDRYSVAMAQTFCRRLNITPQGIEHDTPLMQAAFRGLGAMKTPGSFEGFFFDWFGGEASQTRALNGPRAGAYAQQKAAEFRHLIAGYSTSAPEKLAHPLFAQNEPVTLLYDEIEALWKPIAENDDWSLFYEKLAEIERYRTALGLIEQT